MPQILRHTISLEKVSLLACLKYNCAAGSKLASKEETELHFFHLLRIRERGSTENISVGKAKKKRDHFENLRLHGKIILKLTLKEQSVKI
jgi:hypothetical protein